MKIPIAATRLVMSRLFRLPWLGAVFAVVLVAGALGGVAIAQIDSGDAYTGCLTDGGSINKVAIGNEPLKPCPEDQTEIGWNQTGPQGPAGLSRAFGTGNGDTVFRPGDPPLDFMALDLPAGNYVFNMDMTVYPELLYDDAGNPFLGPGGEVECRLFEEATDGSRVDLTGSKFGTFDPSIQGPEEGLANFALTAIFGHIPEETRLVLVCQHNLGERIDILSANWTAIAVDALEYQPSP